MEIFSFIGFIGSIASIIGLIIAFWQIAKNRDEIKILKIKILKKDNSGNFTGFANCTDVKNCETNFVEKN